MGWEKSPSPYGAGLLALPDRLAFFHECGAAFFVVGAVEALLGPRIDLAHIRLFLGQFAQNDLVRFDRQRCVVGQNLAIGAGFGLQRFRRTRG